MPKGYIQLGASCSSPSICPARATGCEGPKAGPKGRKLEGGPRRGPRLLVSLHNQMSISHECIHEGIHSFTQICFEFLASLSCPVHIMTSLVLSD